MAGERASGQLTISGAGTVSNTVRADVLVQTVQRLQRLVLLAAAAKEGRSMRQRFKPSTDLREAHDLRFGVPVAGSWGLPFVEAGSEHNPNTASGLGLLLLFVLAVQSNDHLRAAQLIPQHNYRDAMLVDLRDMAPAEGADWYVNLSVDGKGSVKLDYDARRVFTAFLVDEGPEEGPGTFIGELQRINFAQQRIHLRHPTTGTSIECSYPPEHEETLLTKRRELVQVMGQVTRTDGDVVEVSDVSMVLPVDLDPFTLPRVQSHGRTLLIHPPLQVTPRLDEESNQSFVFQNEGLDLDVVAPTREALHDEIASTLVFLWEQYALASDHDLTDGAKTLKAQLRARMKEATGGPET